MDVRWEQPLAGQILGLEVFALELSHVQNSK